MRTSFRRTGLWIGLALLVAAAPARGEGQQLARARALFGKGEVHYRLGEFRQAITLYREALRLAPRPNILFNIAQCHRQLGQRRQALFYYRLYLSDSRRVSPKRSPPFEREVREQIARLLKIQGGALPASRPTSQPTASAPSQPAAPAVVQPGASATAQPAAPVTAQPAASAPLGSTAKRPAAFAASHPAPPRRGLWLGLGLSTAGLALAAEAAAIACTVEARDRFTDEPEFATFRDAAIASHVVAGVLAVASVVSWVIYLGLRRGGGARASIELRPAGIAGVF